MWPCGICMALAVEPADEHPFMGWCQKCGALTNGTESAPFPKPALVAYFVVHPRARKPLLSTLSRSQAEEYMEAKGNPDLRVESIPLYALPP